MAVTAPLHQYAYDEYLHFERASNVRHEFLNGEIYAMAGGTPEHAALAAAVSAALFQQLVGTPCHVFSSDLRVRVLATGLATYPDVSVVCGAVERDPVDPKRTVLNPRLIVEVLSNATEAFDRGEKLEHYQRIPSLDLCLLVAHRERLFELWTREANGWARTRAGVGEHLSLAAIGSSLSVDAIYDAATLT